MSESSSHEYENVALAVPNYANGIARFVAFVIDLTILILVFLPFILLVETFYPSGDWILVMLFPVAFWLYYSLMETSRLQATLGKILFGIIVTDLEGNRIRFSKASLRAWILILVYPSLVIIPFLLIFLLIFGFFNDKKQGWHDRIAGCVLIKKPKLSTI